MSSELLTTVRVESLESIDIAQLIALYRACFADPPYEESFEESEVRGFFESYIAQGIVLLCLDKGDIVGFSAALPLQAEDAVATYVSEKVAIPSDTWYFAELGVAKDIRRRGIGLSLTADTIDAIPSKTTLIRTTQANTAAIALYERSGFVLEESLTQEVEQLRTNGETAKDTRVFLIRKRE